MNKNLQLAVDMLYYIGKGQFKEALSTCRELLVILETYERSC